MAARLRHHEPVLDDALLGEHPAQVDLDVTADVADGLLGALRDEHDGVGPAEQPVDVLLERALEVAVGEQRQHLGARDLVAEADVQLAVEAEDQRAVAACGPPDDDLFAHAR
jgi:hypothetical protein